MEQRAEHVEIHGSEVWRSNGHIEQVREGRCSSHCEEELQAFDDDDEQELLLTAMMSSGILSSQTHKPEELGGRFFTVKLYKVTAR